MYDKPKAQVHFNLKSQLLKKNMKTSFKLHSLRIDSFIATLLFSIFLILHKCKNNSTSNKKKKVFHILLYKLKFKNKL